MSNFTLTQQGADSFVYDPITLTYSYTVDVSPGETVSLTGDINLITGGDVYVLGQLNYISIYSMLTLAPGWGDFSLNLATGIFTFTFTADTLATNGGPQTIPLMFLASNGMFGQEALLVEFTITCFCAGTLIATPLGETPVQDLRIGDQILTACGRPVPVKWIGRQTVSTRFGPAERLMPVRFAAGSPEALGADARACQGGAYCADFDGYRALMAQLGGGLALIVVADDGAVDVLAPGRVDELPGQGVGRVDVVGLELDGGLADDVAR